MRQETSLPTYTVSDSAELARLVEEMCSDPAIGLDTESNSFFHYPEQLCLVQIATSRFVAIIDPFACSDMSPLEALLASPAVQKVLHGADYDVRCLDRAWGFRVAGLYDTNVAARFLGMTQVGLAALAEALVGVTLNKDKRLQRADWSRRPLGQEALDYAASDVRHLTAIRDRLEEQLRLLGRTAWVAEECARLTEIRYVPPDQEKAFLGVKGSHGLSPRELAVLRALFAFREREALRQGRPPFYVLGDSALVHLARNPDADLAQTPGLGSAGLQRFGRALERALQEGRDAPPYQAPRASWPRQARPTPQQLARLQKLKVWRTALGEQLSMDPSLLWPSSSLETLALQPDALEQEMASQKVRAWQRQEFGESLRTLLAGL
ncbi:MAG: ribonuclease D [Chloroflexi bacterium]|nr:ribonuclease D [Chloroflexota bacterium]